LGFSSCSLACSVPYTAAVKKALPRYKFFPAENGGRKVPQLVQMPFEFHINH
jgi:hypothetical protein